MEISGLFSKGIRSIMRSSLQDPIKPCLACKGSVFTAAVTRMSIHQKGHTHSLHSSDNAAWAFEVYVADVLK